MKTNYKEKGLGLAVYFFFLYILCTYILFRFIHLTWKQKSSIQYNTSIVSKMNPSTTHVSGTKIHVSTSKIDTTLIYWSHTIFIS